MKNPIRKNKKYCTLEYGSTRHSLQKGGDMRYQLLSLMSTDIVHVIAYTLSHGAHNVLFLHF